MKAPDDKSIDQLLRGTIRQPSDRFEAALCQIPSRASLMPPRIWPAVIRAVAIAAILILSISLFLDSGGRFPSNSGAGESAGLHLDEEWVQLLTLADSLESATSLADAETRFALDYYAFNQ